MPTANQTLGQSLQEMPPVEETPADGPSADDAPAADGSAANIIFVVEVNAITMPIDYQTLGEFLQEMPPVEDAPTDGVPADEAPVNDPTADDVPAANAPANDAPADKYM